MGPSPGVGRRQAPMASIAPMLWWFAASKRGTTCWSALAIPHRRKHRRRRQIPPWRPLALTHETWPAPGRETATGRSSLGWSTANSSEHHAAQHKTREMGPCRKREKRAPGATWSRLGTQDFPRNTVESCTALANRQENR